ncbi:hypothetical protein [Algibacillus agarilyticus]|uniref:hypothetical protein n=1 Tax=Algibacillus agarilyticus TaxID=2234133 RepID=UPI000DCFA8E9|nr:hypothetical protein [Algibacillus agarilyticus]
MAHFLLNIHILTGGIGILAGFMALISTKGSSLHKSSGRLFSVAMLFCGGSIIGLFGLGVKGSNISDALSGLTIIYFIATAFRSLKVGQRSLTTLDYMLFAGVMSIALANVYLGLNASKLALEYPPAQYFVVAFIHFIAVADDLYLRFKRSVGKQYRLIRHSWRMSLVLFMASGAFFLGQMKLFPAVLTENAFILFFIPSLLSLFYMGYWLVRLNIKKTRS